MALWDKLRESAKTMQDQLLEKKSELKSGAFRDASMAICALVAAADGQVEPSERQRTASLITTNEVLQNFPAADLQRRFDAYLDKLAADFDFGKVGVMQDIAKVRKKPAEARAVIQIGIVIGGADGHFDETERSVVREACHALGLPPEEFFDL
ncbi:tellurite resistance TerB family protein [Actinomadura viridis]|uniref:tellurite resistance TerB family protein n=1 Tax=Actinomadura viridis TaxID=58110 RepID=UPI00368D0115